MISLLVFGNVSFVQQVASLKGFRLGKTRQLGESHPAADGR